MKALDLRGLSPAPITPFTLDGAVDFAAIQLQTVKITDNIHVLMGGPAPDWWVTGVPRLEMEDHLKKRQPHPVPARPTTERPIQ